MEYDASDRPARNMLQEIINSAEPLTEEQTAWVDTLYPQDRYFVLFNKKKPIRRWSWRLTIPIIVLLTAAFLPLYSWVFNPQNTTGLGNDECPVHTKDPIHSGFVPTPYQPAFGQAGWDGMPSVWTLPLVETGDVVVLEGLQKRTMSLPRARYNTLEAGRLARKLKTKYDLLPDLKNGDILDQATQRLRGTHTYVETCLGGMLENREQANGYIVLPPLSKRCQAFLAASLHGKALLKHVTTVTANVLAWSNHEIMEVSSVRKDVEPIKRLLRQIYHAVAKDLATIKEVHVNATTPGSLWYGTLWYWTSTSKMDERTTANLRTLQGEYITALWMDYRLSVLDGILKDRAASLQTISLSMGRFDTQESLHVKFNADTNTRAADALNRRLDGMPYRAIARMENATAILARSSETSYRNATCAWTQERMPLDKICSCAGSPTFASPRRWFRTKVQQEHEVRRSLDAVFWETHFDGLMSARGAGQQGVDKRIDIRVHESCRKKQD